jgi:hypothetical protein
MKRTYIYLSQRDACINGKGIVLEYKRLRVQTSIQERNETPMAGGSPHMIYYCRPSLRRRLSSMKIGLGGDTLAL